MRNDVPVKTTKKGNRIRVKVLGQVDGWIDETDGHKLDDILNASYPYTTKISEMRRLVNA